MPIDYSKWDHFLVDTDSDGSERGDNDGTDTTTTTSTPRVTRLDAASRVTFGGSSDHNSNDTIHIRPSTSTTSGAAPATTTVAAMTTAATSAVEASMVTTDTAVLSASSTSTNKPQQQHEGWTSNGGMVVVSNNDQDDPHHQNDQSDNNRRKLYWSQDRYSISLHLELKDDVNDEKVKSVTVDGILPYRDRHCAMGSHKMHLKCIGGSSKGEESSTTTTTTTEELLLLEGDLPHPVHLAEGDEDVDWTIVRRDDDDTTTTTATSSRYLHVTLYKAVPMQGVFLWWKRPLMQFPEVLVVQAVQGNSTKRGTATASQEFLKAWEEAHKMFREKRQQEQQQQQERVDDD